MLQELSLAPGSCQDHEKNMKMREEQSMWGGHKDMLRTENAMRAKNVI